MVQSQVTHIQDLVQQVPPLVHCVVPLVPCVVSLVSRFMIGPSCVKGEGLSRVKEITFIGSVSGPFHTPNGSGAASERSHRRLVLGPCWISPVSRTGLRWYRCTSIRYPVPGARHSHRTGPNGPRMAPKGPFDPPKGSGSILKEVTRDRFWARVGPHHDPETRGFLVPPLDLHSRYE